MNATLTDEDCYAIFKASQDAWLRMECLKNNRSFKLEILYLTMKDSGIVDSSIDSIMQSIAILTDKEAEQRKKYSALVQAHAAAVDALPGNPPLNDAQRIY